MLHHHLHRSINNPRHFGLVILELPIVTVTYEDVISAINGTLELVPVFKVPRDKLDFSYGDVYSPSPFERDCTHQERINASRALLIARIKSEGIEPPEGWALARADVVDFIGGVAPLDGVWFGGKHPTEKGDLWWRNRLSAAPKDPKI